MKATYWIIDLTLNRSKTHVLTPSRFIWCIFCDILGTLWQIFLRRVDGMAPDMPHDPLPCVRSKCYGGGGAEKGAWSGVVSRGALPYKPIRDVPFFRVSFFNINSWTRYHNLSKFPKRVMTICSRTKSYCFKNTRLLFSLLFLEVSVV